VCAAAPAKYKQEHRGFLRLRELSNEHNKRCQQKSINTNTGPSYTLNVRQPNRADGAEGADSIEWSSTASADGIGWAAAEPERPSVEHMIANRSTIGGVALICGPTYRVAKPPSVIPSTGPLGPGVPGRALAFGLSRKTPTFTEIAAHMKPFCCCCYTRQVLGLGFLLSVRGHSACLSR
jgi:hypothetical protein